MTNEDAKNVQTLMAHLAGKFPVDESDACKNAMAAARKLADLSYVILPNQPGKIRGDDAVTYTPQTPVTLAEPDPDDDRNV